MSYKNNSAGKSYYTQRNNKIKPGSSCNVTSMICALSAAGWPVDQMAPTGTQPEDALLKFIMTDPVCETRWKRLDPDGEYPPNEWHEILALGTNRWIKALGYVYTETPVDYRGRLTVQDIKGAINDGGAAVVSGRFAANGKQLDHVVSIVGYEDSALILDDPYGDYRDGYTTQNGNDIPMSRADFIGLIKPQGKPVKYGHMVRRYIDAG